MVAGRLELAVPYQGEGRQGDGDLLVLRAEPEAVHVQEDLHLIHPVLQGWPRESQGVSMIFLDNVHNRPKDPMFDLSLKDLRWTSNRIAI